MTDTMPLGPLFPYGQTVATPGALAVLSLTRIAPEILLDRHVRGDWGDLFDNGSRAKTRAGTLLVTHQPQIKRNGTKRHPSD